MDWAYTELYFHLVYRTVEPDILITPDQKIELQRYYDQRCRNTRGVSLLRVNVLPDHTHVLFSSQPGVTLSSFVGDIKGASSRHVTTHFNRPEFGWHRGYGLVSFAEKHLAAMVDYVDQQDQLHQQGKTRPRLERSDPNAPQACEETG